MRRALNVAELRARFRRTVATLVAIMIVATGAALFALTFRAAYQRVFASLLHEHDPLVAFAKLPAALQIVVPCVGGVIAGLLAGLSTRIGGSHGVGGVMEALAMEDRRISVRATALRALGSWVAIATGGSVGREGPLIQFGAAVGGAVSGWLDSTPKLRRALIASGTAAGFAAAYNTPFAAMLFVFEVVVGSLSIELLPHVALATATSTAISRVVMGGGPIYGVRTFTLVGNSELGAHAVLGLIAGVAGVLFMMLLAHGEHLFERLPVPRYVRTGLGGLGLGLIALGLPEVTGNGFEAIALLLDGRLAFSAIVVLMFAKAMATTSSVGSGTPGGVFTPSLFLGAAVGGIFGHVAGVVLGPDNVGPVGGYALVGMASVVAATTHAPMMAAVLVFELSGDYAIVLPLLISTAGATVVARSLRTRSIYTAELERHGLSIHEGVAGRELRWVDGERPEQGGGI